MRSPQWGFDLQICCKEQFSSQTSGYALKVVESGLYYLLYYLFKPRAREEEKWVSLPPILTPGVPIESSDHSACLRPARELISLRGSCFRQPFSVAIVELFTMVQS